MDFPLAWIAKYFTTKMYISNKILADVENIHVGLKFLNLLRFSKPMVYHLLFMVSNIISIDLYRDKYRKFSNKGALPIRAHPLYSDP